MAFVIKRFLEGYKYVILDIADHRLQNLPLINSPIPTITITTVYLLFVLKWGPEFMKNREPYNLRKTMIVYNAIQSSLCFIGVFIATFNIDFGKWYCLPIIPAEEDYVIKYLGYGYLILKIIDLLDTVFFILRKNYRQVTVLHVCHHAVMPSLVWIVTKYVATGHNTYMAYLNSAVHAVMYGYYLLSAYDPKYKDSLVLKKSITQMQLAQFFLGLFLYILPLIIGCDSNPKGLFYLLIAVNSFMAVMFSNFYYQTYIKKKKT